ncbi:uncharacterized protein [Miscanthus floridulus]|uniref:uncharacterized protein n=1 Tax=Miscanthus floridulus TaxID=154761 RepID=UPI003458D52E
MARDQLRYSQIIGSLMYVANATMLDISFAVCKLSRLVETSDKEAKAPAGASQQCKCSTPQHGSSNSYGAALRNEDHGVPAAAIDQPAREAARPGARGRGRAAASASEPSLAGRLGDAYGRIEELVRLHGDRDAPLSARWRSAVEAELDASVALLDLCQCAREAVASAKQHVSAARRAVRRRRARQGGCARVRPVPGEGGEARRRRQDLLSRRGAPANADGTPAAVKVLSEAVAVTVAVLSSLSKRVADTGMKSRWCVVSKLLGTNDWSLVGVCKDLEGHEGAMSAQETLQELEDGVEAVESGLEHLFRHIVQARVALLNVLTL